MVNNSSWNFLYLAATIQTYISYVDDEVRRTITDQTIQDAVAGPLALLLTLFAYYRLRPEGIEDGMTYGGEEWENKAEDFNVMVIAFAMVLGLHFECSDGSLNDFVEHEPGFAPGSMDLQSIA